MPAISSSIINRLIKPLSTPPQVYDDLGKDRPPLGGSKELPYPRHLYNTRKVWQHRRMAACAVLRWGHAALCHAVPVPRRAALMLALCFS